LAKIDEMCFSTAPSETTSWRAMPTFEGELGAVAGDHEQRVVDADTKADHRRHGRGEVSRRQHCRDQRDGAE
jgi:hypothetical protein